MNVVSTAARHPVTASDSGAAERQRKYYRMGMNHGREVRGGVAGPAAGIARTLGVTEAEAVRQVVADYRQRLDSLPATSKHPELRGMRECVVAYNRGLADAAGISEDDAAVMANYLWFITRRLHGRTRPPGPGCTLVYFPRSDRGALVANNNDSTANYAHRREPVWIVANRAGLILGTVSSGIFDDEVSAESFPAPVFTMTQEKCTRADEAVDLMTRLNHFWGPCNALVADAQGNSAIIEKSTCRCGVRKSPDGFSATTEMSAEEPTFKQYLWDTRRRHIAKKGMTEDSPDWVYWKAAERRSARLLRLVDNEVREPTFAGIERVIYDHIGEPEQIHMDGSKCHPDQEAGEWSLRTTIWVIDELAAQSSFAEPPTTSGHLTPRTWKKFEPIEFEF